MELGKKGAGEVICLKNLVVSLLYANQEKEYCVGELAKELTKCNQKVDPENLFKILQHLIHNPESGIMARRSSGADKESILYYTYRLGKIEKPISN